VDAHAPLEIVDLDAVVLAMRRMRVAAVLLTPYPPGIPLRAAAVAAGQG